MNKDNKKFAFLRSLGRKIVRNNLGRKMYEYCGKEIGKKWGFIMKVKELLMVVHKKSCLWILLLVGQRERWTKIIISHLLFPKKQLFRTVVLTVL